jgi:hypothetical protein
MMEPTLTPPNPEIQALQKRRCQLLQQICHAADEIKQIDTKLAKEML